MNHFRLLILLLATIELLVLFQNFKAKSQFSTHIALGNQTTEAQGDAPWTTPQPSPTIISSPSLSSPQGNIQAFLYPGSRIQSESNNHMMLQSSDTTDTITDWYRSTLLQMNLQINIFVKTNSNESIRNTLSAKSTSKLIYVIITKSPNNSFATIEIERD